ncbi:hypothetical protein [uncultured Aquimarina sp.]|uniref:hypothetical protein n=1 Tax=uncultured Aquimarina sp. TaxID=575652 RepID=UPI002639C490|nr:hypothetical protein [uncultured Aquimarina sp.]
MKKSTLVILLFGIVVISILAWFISDSSREVLTAFGEMENTLKTNSLSVEIKNDSLLSEISDKKLVYKAKQVDSLTTNFKEYLESVKQEMLGSIKDPKNYELMDKPNNMFFFENGLSEKGEEFIAKMNQFRDRLLILVETPSLKNEINNILNTGQVYSRNGERRKWLEYNFKGFPLIASITKLTQMQVDVSSIESKIFLDCLGK